jgi:hypothetical protein
MSNQTSIPPVGMKTLISGGTRCPSLQEIEQAETGLWVEQQMNRVRDLLVKHGADVEMLDAVDYMMEENSDWIDDRIAEDLRAGTCAPVRRKASLLQGR